MPGGFSSLYPVLRALEDAGRVRRGYFIEGLGGAQFASPGAVDRLRQPSEDEPLLLAAADPANPYGAAVPWPTNEAGRPSRSSGAFVITVGGRLAVFVERGGRKVLTFTADDAALTAAVTGMRRLAGRRRRFEIETIDGEKAVNTALGSLLVASGFIDSYKGLAFRE